MRSTSIIIAGCLLLASATNAVAGFTEGGGGEGPDPGSSGPEPTTITKYFSYQPAWGNVDWGANLYAAGSITATAAMTQTQRDKLDGEGSLTASAVINGSRYRLLGLRARAAVENGRTADLRASAALGGADFWTHSQHSELANNVATLIAPSWEKTMYDARVGVWVGPVPVTFRAKVTGQLSAGLTASFNVTRFGLTFTPAASASLYASAAIGGEYCVATVCAGASAGVYTDLTLFAVRAPTRLEAALTPMPEGMSVSFLLRSDATVASLGGALGVFAEAHLGDASYKGPTELITWPGLSTTANLTDQSATSCLVGSCLISITPPIGRR